MLLSISVKAGAKCDRQCVNEKLPVPWQNKGNDVYHGRPEWIIGQNMPFVPQPSRSCGILGSTNRTQATFWDKFSFWKTLPFHLPEADCPIFTLSSVFLSIFIMRFQKLVSLSFLHLYCSIRYNFWFICSSVPRSCRACVKRARQMNHQSDGTIFKCKNENNTSLWKLMITVDGKKSHMVENVGSMLLPGSLAACVSHWQPVLPTICTGAWALNIFTAASPCTNPTPWSALVRWLVSVSCLKKSHHSLQLIKRFAFSLTVSVLLSLLVSFKISLSVCRPVSANTNCHQCRFQFSVSSLVSLFLGRY